MLISVRAEASLIGYGSKSEPVLEAKTRADALDTFLQQPGFPPQDQSFNISGLIPVQTSLEFLEKLTAELGPFPDNTDLSQNQILPQSPDLGGSFLDDAFYASLAPQSTGDFGDNSSGLDVPSSSSDFGLASSSSSCAAAATVAIVPTNDTASISAASPFPSWAQDDLVQHHLVGAFADVAVTEPTYPTEVETDADTWRKIMDDLARVPESAGPPPMDITPSMMDQSVAFCLQPHANTPLRKNADISSVKLAEHPRFPRLKERAEGYLRLVVSHGGDRCAARGDYAVARSVVGLTALGGSDRRAAASLEGCDDSDEVGRFIASMMEQFQQLIGSFQARRATDRAEWQRIQSKLTMQLASVGDNEASKPDHNGAAGASGARKGQGFRYSMTKRREPLSPVAVKKLRDWLENNTKAPYPDEDQKDNLSMETGLSVTQINNWFINARRRILPKMLRIR